VVDPGRAFSTQGKIFWFDSESENDWQIIADYREGTMSARPWAFPPVFYVGPPVPRFIPRAEPLKAYEHPRWFPLPHWGSEQLNAKSYYRFFSLPYWLLATGYAVVWLAAVAHWQRRKARLFRHSAASTA